MGRAPCCEKLGLKKGPWTPDEDQILINYIRIHGHSNWRALPKLAGLLRCGKSCRLRWTNYLRPDIKRGNFTQEEEDTIIELHQLLGNKWSTIAGRLPGRTDNEIKNVWHSHLKKRLPKPNSEPTFDGPVLEPTRKRARKSKVTKKDTSSKKIKSEHVKCVKNDDVTNNGNNNNNNNTNDNNNNNSNNIKKDNNNNNNCNEIMSPQPCTSEMSTITSSSTNASENDKRGKDHADFVDEITDDFWMEVLPLEDTAMSTKDLHCIAQYDQNTLLDHLTIESMFESSPKVDDNGVDLFWFNLLTRSSELPELCAEML